MELTDKDLHCIARCFQTRIFSEDALGCMYCKYEAECRGTFEAGRKVHFLHGLPRKLEEITGVHVHFVNMGDASKEYLAGSWVEDYPELLAELTNMSFERQQGILKSPDILQCIRSMGHAT